MGYETKIPDGWVPPQFIDEKFQKAREAIGRKRAAGPHVWALARPELDPSSRVHYELGTGANYDIKAKTDQVAMMHVLSAGPGRMRLGYREHVSVAPGDMVLVNLREAGHWMYVGGVLIYTFTSDVAMAKVYRTDKPLTAPEDREARDLWRDELFWNLREVLNDYVVLGRDPRAEAEFRGGSGERLIEFTDASLADGTRSDDARDSRFPIVYRRVLGAGPGRRWRREFDGLPDYEHSLPEVQPGDVMAYTKSVKAAELTFQGAPLEIIHSASVLGFEDNSLVAHQSCAKPIPWDVEKETDAEEEDRLKGKTG